MNRTSANDEVVWRIQVAQDNILGERKDPVKIQHAYLDLERMAQMSIVESYYPLGVCYYRGSASDERKAVHWLSLAIKEGDKRLKQGGHSDLLYTHVARANYCLGEIFANKSDKALPYLQTAAQMGHATAQHIMGHRYQYDDVDLDRASAWYELAAQQGYGKAQAALGALLLEYPDHWAATAATRDQVVQTAIGWLNLAANQVRRPKLVIHCLRCSRQSYPFVYRGMSVLRCSSLICMRKGSSCGATNRRHSSSTNDITLMNHDRIMRLRTT